MLTNEAWLDFDHLEQVDVQSRDLNIVWIGWWIKSHLLWEVTIQFVVASIYCEAGHKNRVKDWVKKREVL